MASHPNPDPDDDASSEQASLFPREPQGEVNVRLEIDAETYDRLRAAYWQAVRAGYEDGFPLFVYNHCTVATETVVVDGEAVDPEAGDWPAIDGEE